jgi:hypothetical protein
MSPEDLFVPILGSEDTEKKQVGDRTGAANPVTKSARVDGVRAQILLKDHAKPENEVTSLGLRAKSPLVSFTYLSFFLSLPDLREFSMSLDRFFRARD